MALTPIDAVHALQIQAGTLGRREGHSFEDRITETINGLKYPCDVSSVGSGHVFRGDPARLLLQYIGLTLRSPVIKRAAALSTGALATSKDGKKWLLINGVTVSRCKSDLILQLEMQGGNETTIGVSTKQCNNKTPTNAQLYFTTARAFSNLLRTNGVEVTGTAVNAMRQFCGDLGFRPLDNHSIATGRKVDPRRFFWEEIELAGRNEWESILTQHQDFVFRLLLQKAYMDDPFVPEFLIHKTKNATAWADTEVAIYSVDELVALSHVYQGFVTRPYSVRKGSFKDPSGVIHLAPRFGIVQMQRGGQAQHPDQLQFNLESGYFYKIGGVDGSA